MLTKEVLQLEYCENKLSYEAIADKYGLSPSHIGVLRKKYDLPPKCPNKAGKIACNRKDLKGKKFGLLTVIELANQDNVKRGMRWLCQCECGRTHVVRTSLLTMGRTKSCGCLKRARSNNWTGYGEISGSYWTSICIHADTQNREINISLKYIWQLFLKQNRKCALSGVELKFSSNYKRKKNQTASLDRIDSKKGYIKGNVQWVHKNVNRMKQHFTNDDFVCWCQMIANHQSEIKLAM